MVARCSRDSRKALDAERPDVEAVRYLGPELVGGQARLPAPVFGVVGSLACAVTRLPAITAAVMPVRAALSTQPIGWLGCVCIHM